MNMNRRAYLHILALLAVGLLSVHSIADSQLPVRNDTTQDVNVWIWPQRLGEYAKSPLFVPADKKRHLRYQDGETYWIVAVDEQGRQAPVGWVDVSAAVRDNPKVELVLGMYFETKTSECRFFDRCLRQWRTKLFDQKIGKFDAVIVVPDDQR